MFTLFHLFECFCYMYEGDNDRCPVHGWRGRVIRLVMVVIFLGLIFMVLLAKGA